MKPTLLPNERIYLQQLGYGEIKRWDIVVVHSDYFNKRIVKRVVALPGECIRILNSWQVEINGSLLPEVVFDELNNVDTSVNEHEHRIQLVRDPTINYPVEFGLSSLCLDSDEYFVLGDNRLASGDSRIAGPVKRKSIQGRLWRIWYSFDKSRSKMRWERLGRYVGS